MNDLNYLHWGYLEDDQNYYYITNNIDLNNAESSWNIRYWIGDSTEPLISYRIQSLLPKKYC